MRNRRFKVLFLAFTAMILVAGTAPALAWDWNPLFFWKKKPVQQEAIAPEPFLGFFKSKKETPAPAPYAGSTVTSATAIMQNASRGRMDNVEKLITERRRLNADMAVMRQKQRAYGAQLAALDKQKTYAPVNPAAEKASVEQQGITEPGATEKPTTTRKIYVKPGAMTKPPKVFTNFR